MLNIGCGHQQAPVSTDLSLASHPVSVFSFMDRLVDENGVKNAGVFPVKGYPWLRVNRFLAGLTPFLTTQEKKIAWLDTMRRMDLKARKAELRNLPPAAIQALAVHLEVPATVEAVFAQLEERSSQAMAHFLSMNINPASIAEVIEIPEDYSTWMRIAGLYPLVALPVAYATRQAYDKIEQWHATDDRQLPIHGRLIYYVPDQSVDFSVTTIGKLLSRSKNSLNMFTLDETDQRFLARMLAPVWIQDVAGTYDRIGQVILENGQIRVAPSHPVVYYYMTHAFYRETPVMQINYVAWYTRRDGSNAPWIERGMVDGLTVRVSLQPSGEPFMVDIMNNCGCYHFFVPSKANVRSIKPEKMGIDPLVPAWLSDTVPDQRIGLRIESGWHQVRHVGSVARPWSSDKIGYRLMPYDTLESLPDQTGQGYGSMFNDKGIVEESRRIEPFIFFSMGIPKVGYMRQRGHHPTKLVGKQHFDDPWLFNKTFDLTPLNSDTESLINSS